MRAWVDYSRTQREQHFQELIQHVRLPLLSRDYLVDRVEVEPLMKRCSGCKDYLIEAMKYHLLPRAQRLLLQTPRTKTRTPGRPKILYVVGGQAPKAIRRFLQKQYYNVSLKILNCTLLFRDVCILRQKYIVETLF